VAEAKTFFEEHRSMWAQIERGKCRAAAPKAGAGSTQLPPPLVGLDPVPAPVTAENEAKAGQVKVALEWVRRVESRAGGMAREVFGATWRWGSVEVRTRVAATLQGEVREWSVGWDRAGRIKVFGLVWRSRADREEHEDEVRRVAAE
jgi:hypothetical protein